MNTYILDDRGRPIRIDDRVKWGAWIHAPERRDFALLVEKTEVVQKAARRLRIITTFFLTWDRAENPGTDEPLLWESMLCGMSEYRFYRCGGTVDDARELHWQVVHLAERSETALLLPAAAAKKLEAAGEKQLSFMDGI